MAASADAIVLANRTPQFAGVDFEVEIASSGYKEFWGRVSIIAKGGWTAMFVGFADVTDLGIFAI